MVQKNVEKKSLSENLGDFILRNLRVIFVFCGVLLLGAVCAVVVISVNEKTIEKGLGKIDLISYELTNKSYDLSETEIAARQDKAVLSLSELVGKSGIVGVRANMLSAEIYYQKKDFENARSAWLAAAQKGKNTYIAPIAFFNAASCSEELGNLDDAAAGYKSASEVKDFYEAAHALFSLGRVQEAKEDFVAAAASYQALVDKSPEDSWAKLAKNRLVSLKISGKVE
ncbi:MAG: tetratricopeptide repeat protein [Treponema sp.]|nr:tetratricopeptide repeat protein [Treponema sp.]MDY2924004.1 tetratricopeptide repeat protein [Treponema sp.]